MARARNAQDSVEFIYTDTTSRGFTTEDVIEFLQAWTVGAAPTGSFGASITQRVVEFLQTVEGNGRITQHVVEFLVGAEGGEGGGAGGTVGYGYAL